MNALNVQRERDETPAVKVVRDSGEVLTRKPDGNMYPLPTRPQVVRGDHEASIRITGRTLPEVRKHLLGLKRTYRALDVEAMMKDVVVQTELVRERLTFAFPPLGGADGYRAVVKIALGYYLHVGGDPAQVAGMVEVVRKDSCPSASIVGGYYHQDPWRQRELGSVTHILAVVSDGFDLYAYVELLRVFRFSVRLSDTYCGPPIRSAYAFDVLTQSILPITCNDLVSTTWTPEEDLHRESIELELDRVMRIAEARSVSPGVP